MSRPVKILLFSIFISVLLVTFCLIFVGGQLGFGLMGLFFAIEIRQVLKLLIAGGGFTLDGRPLPHAMYFIPAPPSGRDGRVGYFGLGSLLFLVAFGFCFGYLMGKGPFISPFSARPFTIIFSIVGGVIWGILFSLIILITESNWRKPSSIDPGLTFALMLVFIILIVITSTISFPQVYDGGYKWGWGFRSPGCIIKHNSKTGNLNVQFLSDARVVFARGFESPVSANFKNIEICLPKSSEFCGVRIGLYYIDPESKKPKSHWTSIEEYIVEDTKDFQKFLIPRKAFPESFKTFSSLRLTRGGIHHADPIELHSIRIISN